VRSGYVPREVLAIGDATTEYEAARALGIPFFGVVAPGEPNLFSSTVPAQPTLDGLAESLGLRQT